MGATKRVSEMYLQAINNKLSNIKRYNTKFSIVRFGNVWVQGISDTPF